MTHEMQATPTQSSDRRIIAFLDKVSPSLVLLSIAIAFNLINIYFTVAAHDSRIEALETNTVLTGNQVIANTTVLVGVNKDLDEIKSDVKEVLRRLPAKE